MNFSVLVAAMVVVLIALGIALWFYRPIGVFLGLVALGGITLTLVSIHRSTFPSAAPRVTVVGQVMDWNRHHTRRRHWWTFVLKPSPDQRLMLKTGIEIPEDDSARAAIESGDTLRVTYLDENSILSDRRAIRIDVLTGRFVGWSGSEDANWLGWWIGTPVGALVAILSFGYAQIWKRKRRDGQDVASDQPDSAIASDQS